MGPANHSCRAFGRLMRMVGMAILPCAIALAGCAQSGSGPGVWDDTRQESDLAILRLIEAEDYEGVLHLTDSLIAAGADDPRIKGQRALALGMTGGEAEAVTFFEEAILADYANCENHLNFAVLLMKTGRTGRALTEFAEAQRFCPDSKRAVIYRNLAVANLKMDREGKALTMVEEGLSYDGDDPYLIGLKGMLVSASDPVLAESLIVAAEEAGEISDDFLYQFGLLLLRTDRPSRALIPLEKVARRNPARSEYALNYIEALMRAGRWEEAGIELRELRRVDPSERSASMLGRVLFSLGDFSGALEIYRSLPPTPENRDRVAMSLHRLGRSAEAAAIEREVVAERPDWTVGLINLSAMLGALGELEEAESLLVRVLEIDPENAVARVNLQTLRDARSESEGE